jgi:hypothetical protein
MCTSLAKHKNLTVFISGSRMVMDGVKSFQERKLTIMIKEEN